MAPTKAEILEANKTAFLAEIRDIKITVEALYAYRDRMGKWVSGIAIVRAVASSSAISAWVIWRQYPTAWAAVIVASQLWEAVGPFFPLAQRHEAAGRLADRLTLLLDAAESTYYRIYAGQINTSAAIIKEHANLRSRQRAAVHAEKQVHLRPSARQMEAAKLLAKVYIEQMTGGGDVGTQEAGG